jgi:hypothetical protein
LEDPIRPYKASGSPWKREKPSCRVHFHPTQGPLEEPYEACGRPFKPLGTLLKACKRFLKGPLKVFKMHLKNRSQALKGLFLKTV